MMPTLSSLVVLDNVLTTYDQYHRWRQSHDSSVLSTLLLSSLCFVPWINSALNSHSDSDSDNVYSTKIDTDTISGLQKNHTNIHLPPVWCSILVCDSDIMETEIYRCVNTFQGW